MPKSTTRVTTREISEAADRLLYGQWVPVPKDFLNAKQVRGILRDFLDLNTSIGATRRYILSLDVEDGNSAEADVDDLIREAVRLYLGVLHYGLGAEIPSEVLAFLEKGNDNGKDS